MFKSKTSPSAAAAAAFDLLHATWWKAQCDCDDPTFDDSDETSERLCSKLYAAEEALRAAPTPTKGQLKHKFHYLECSIEKDNDGDIKAAITAIKKDLRRWGFDLPDYSPGLAIAEET